MVTRRPLTVLTLLACLTLGGVLWVPRAAQAATRYVATNGSNANAGTQAAPWLTLQHAVDNTGPGDTILVRAGTYAGMSFVNAGGGTAGNPKTIQAFSGETVILDRNLRPTHFGSLVAPVILFEGAAASYIVIDGLKITDLGSPRPNIPAPWTSAGGYDGTACGQWAAAVDKKEGLHFIWSAHAGDVPHHITIKNSEIYNMPSFGMWGTVDFLELLDNKIHNNGRRADNWYGYGYATYLNGNGMLIRGNEVYDNLTVGLRFAAQGGQSSDLRNSIIENNRIYNNYGRMSHCWPHDPVGDADSGGYGISIFGGSGNLIRNNLVYGNAVDELWGGKPPPAGSACAEQCRSGCPSRCDTTPGNMGILLFPWCWNCTPAANRIYHNTIWNVVGPQANGVYIWDQGMWGVAHGGSVARNNITYQTTANYIGAGQSGSHNQTTDPGFVSAATGDFQLQAGSSAINAGLPLTEVPVDILGVARSTVSPTIGAYEGAGGVAPPPNTYVLTRNLSTVAAGQSIIATWGVDPGPAQANDWICLVIAGQPCTSFIGLDGAGNAAWAYTGGALNGTFTIAAPLQAGSYQFGYCLNGGFTCPTYSTAFTVTTPPVADQYVLVAAAWHPADVPPSSRWIEGVGGQAQVRPGGKLRYVGSIACKGCAGNARFFPLQCQIDVGGALTVLTDSCATYPLCYATDTHVAMGDATTQRLPLDAGMTGVAGRVVAAAVNPAATVTATNNQQFDMTYVVRFAPTIELRTVLCRPVQADGAPLDHYQAQLPARVFTGEFRLTGGTIR